MKLKKTFIALIALISLSTFFSAANNSINIVQAEKVPTEFPKNMHGTWYFYWSEGPRKYITKIQFSKKKYISNNSVQVIHKYIPHDEPDFKRADWLFITGYQKQRGITWLNVKQWNEPAGIGIPNTGDDGEDGGWGENGGEFYNIRKIKGHQMLSIANTINGTAIHNTSHWFRTVKLAKKYSMHHYKGFLY